MTNEPTVAFESKIVFVHLNQERKALYSARLLGLDGSLLLCLEGK